MELAVGTRICLGPHRGTIRYRGAVAPSTGEWLGIEWDDPTRGKHDGTSADGTRYFHVRIPGSGSFIRPTSSKISSGCCFLEALRNKYLPPAETPPKSHQDLHLQQYSRKNIADMEIEAPNLDRIAKKTARLDRLKDVGLGGWQQSSLPDVEVEAIHDPHYHVATAFDDDKGFELGSIRSTCPNIRWLDLSRSLLPDWEQISLITTELEHLHTLLLHFNRLQSPPPQIPMSWIHRLGHIQDLRLDGTLFQWQDLLNLSPALTRLTHLQLGNNRIDVLDASSVVRGGKQDEGEVLASLTCLSLEDNQISSWPSLIAALALLPSLKSLNLNRNRISNIPAPTTSTPKLPHLTELHLQDNPIDSWSSLEHITQWTHHNHTLSALHISTLHDDEKLLRSNASSRRDLMSRYEYRDFRAIAIARLASLKILDNTPITCKERRDAELYVYTRVREGDGYIINGVSCAARQGGGEDGEGMEISGEEKVGWFPRFRELAMVFDGEDVGGMGGEVRREGGGRNTLRSKMISLTVFASDTAPLGRGFQMGTVYAEAKVHILASMPMRLAKIKLASAVGVKPSQISQLWAMLSVSQAVQEGEGEGEGERIVLEVDDMSRNLDWYEVSSGDQLVLVTKP